MSFIRTKHILFLLITIAFDSFGQNPFKGMEFTNRDAIFTTYAAPLSRSNYKTDQAYELMWMDPSKPLGLQSKEGGELGVIFTKGKQVASKLGQYAKEPVITQSYNDIVCLKFEPFSGLEVQATFCVYSSNATILEYILTNTSGKAISINVLPFYFRSQGVDFNASKENKISFAHSIKRDAWMVEHQIPLVENLSDELIFSEIPEHILIADSLPGDQELLSGIQGKSATNGKNHVLLFQKLLVLEPGEKKKISLIRNSFEAGTNNFISVPSNYNAAKILAENEVLYAKLPAMKSRNEKDAEYVKNMTGLYYGAFSLMRQCMMPAEGKCKNNYYVFSREPRWGWGYGGQVFHESLAMLAYVYMDPKSAMNSQRVFMERQESDGYINYRTGPYLDEKIETRGMKTSSAPWFSYINYEIYKVTKDQKFLLESYESGRKLYDWFVRNRDKDEDGLYEWGADATLECVRDGLVATWDKVSKPENLEGPDLNSMMVKEAMSLAHMAKELKMDSDSRRYFELAKKTARMINKQLWDPETAFYYNTLLSTNSFTFLEPADLKIKEIIGFLPLWANVCSKEQADQLLRSLYNPEEFWRPYGVPTLSAKDDFYNPMGYWNGPVWVQWQYLVYRGLKDYGYERLAGQLADKVFDQMIWHLKNDHTFWEFYSPDDRQAGWNKTYIWAGLVARMMIE
ncbi:MAG: hypothetical protein IPH84_20640 [Bacteroidales bacterium]|nr:hypothetical protein [Bacteroidales bacterium]